MLMRHLFLNRQVKNKILISWEIKPGYYLYKKSISIQNSDNIVEA